MQNNSGSVNKYTLLPLQKSMFKLVFSRLASKPKDLNLHAFTYNLPSQAKAWLLMICWTIDCRRIT